MRKAPKFGLETCFVSVLLVAGAVISAVSWGYGFGSLSQPGPGLYPFFVGGAIAVFSIFILISEARSPAGKATLDKKDARTLALMTATFCLWIVVMPLLGYVVVTLLATYAFCKIMKLEGWWKPLAVSGGTALFIWLLFDYWLYIDLPRGILE
jgi:putative tricarboxylic transport membrane protein